LVGAVGEHVATLAIKGDFSFVGHPVNVVVVNFDSSNRLNGLYFSVQPAEQNALLDQLKQALGEPRTMTTREANIYDQIVEWNRSQVSVSLWAVTQGPRLTDAAVRPLSVRLWLGPLQSQIEQAEKQKKALQERFGTTGPQR
jgi:hypothetical protein